MIIFVNWMISLFLHGSRYSSNKCFLIIISIIIIIFSIIIIIIIIIKY